MLRTYDILPLMAAMVVVVIVARTVYAWIVPRIDEREKYIYILYSTFMLVFALALLALNEIIYAPNWQQQLVAALFFVFVILYDACIAFAIFIRKGGLI